MDACRKQTRSNGLHEPGKGNQRADDQEQDQKPGRGLPIRYLLVLWVMVAEHHSFP